MQNILKLSFFIIFGGQLVGRYLASDLLDYIFKPLIMPCLIGLLIVSKSKNLSTNALVFQKRILIGFVFSWIGDIALMLEKFNPSLFLVGLSAFLVAHIFYITAFYHSIQSSSGRSLFARQFYFFLPLLLYGIGFYYFLFPNLQSFAMPVLVYVVVICAMGCFALNRKGLVKEQSFKFIFYGALWFMLSDSLIAMNKFMLQIPMSGVWVMLTYMIAQYQIMRGTVSGYE